MTTIEWTEETWNPIGGCRRVSPGCGGPHNEGGCYAERQAIRFAGPGGKYEGLVESTPNGPRWTGATRLHADTLLKPLLWEKPRTIFVNSMSDLGYERFGWDEVAEVYAVMLLGHWHTYQVLTKRTNHLRLLFEDSRFWQRVINAGVRLEAIAKRRGRRLLGDVEALVHGPPVPWIWLGASAENQDWLDRRIVDLLATPAAKHFISYEPALGAIDAREYMPGDPLVRSMIHHDRTGHDCGGHGDQAHCEACGADFSEDAATIDWVICGAESGPRNRPMMGDWARSMRDQCVDAGIPYMLKQFATDKGKKISLPLLDGQQWAQMPEVCRA